MEIHYSIQYIFLTNAFYPAVTLQVLNMLFSILRFKWCSLASGEFTGVYMPLERNKSFLFLFLRKLYFSILLNYKHYLSAANLCMVFWNKKCNILKRKSTNFYQRKAPDQNISIIYREKLLNTRKIFFP